MLAVIKGYYENVQVITKAGAHVQSKTDVIITFLIEESIK